MGLTKRDFCDGMSSMSSRLQFKDDSNSLRFIAKLLPS
jgi:hypothetical protein